MSLSFTTHPSPTLTPSPYHPPILPFSHIHPFSLPPSHTSQTNGEGVEWQYLVNEYVCLLTKCANHLGLLLPDKTPSKRQKQKVVYDHRLLALQYLDLLIQGYPASFPGFPPPSHKSLGMRLALYLLILCEAGYVWSGFTASHLFRRPIRFVKKCSPNIRYSPRCQSRPRC